MSFNLGNIGDRPLIQKSQSLGRDGGGGGNLGYFQGGRQKKEEDNMSSIFEKEIEDEFLLSEEALEALNKTRKEEPKIPAEESFISKGMNFLENLLKK